MARMLTLINSNRLKPPIAPLGIDYVAGAARAAGIEVEVLDLGLVVDAADTLAAYFHEYGPRLIGVSFRNVDDCFWPSAQSYVPELIELVASLRTLSDAPIVLGGVGLSVFARQLMQLTGADFAVHGDGEQAIVALYQQLQADRRFSEVPGLCWMNHDECIANAPAWSGAPNELRPRDAIDNREYYRRGGQGGIETKRGCPRRCIYCADPVAKGRHVRMRDPKLVAEEAAALHAQGIEVLHFCDGEFNIPRYHAAAVCEALISRGLGSSLRYYIYAAVRPFDAELAQMLRRSGCVGINFTGDAADPQMLLGYRAAHRSSHLQQAVKLCKAEAMACMVDLLLGGPGETPETLAATLRTMQEFDPDCVGASLGMRLYPDTPAVEQLLRQGSLEKHQGTRRRYRGPVDLLWPTFYISPALGSQPARLVRDIIGDDPRFFPPAEEDNTNDGHNYSDNTRLVESIARGARGAYWDLLRRCAASV